MAAAYLDTRLAVDVARGVGHVPLVVLKLEFSIGVAVTSRVLPLPPEAGCQFGFDESIRRTQAITSR